MFKNSVICQYTSKKVLFDRLRPAIALPTAFTICFFNSLITDIINCEFSLSNAMIIFLFISSILLTIIYCYIEYTTLSSYLDFVITKDGITRKLNKSFIQTPWSQIGSIKKWSSADGWEIHISTIQTKATSNKLMLDNTADVKTFVVNNTLRPFYIKNNESAYLEKICTLKENSSEIDFTITEKFKPWKYLKQRIYNNLILMVIIAFTFASIYTYWLW